MLHGVLILVVSFLYLWLLFAIAYFGDRRADMGRSLIANPYVYSLSIAVYCTSWTFYGSVGRAAHAGLDFVTIYLGPTLAFVLWWWVIGKIIRISKVHRLTTIADFVSSRYGKSPLLSGLVTVIAVVAVTPYISLQLKAVSQSFAVLLHYPDLAAIDRAPVPVIGDTALLVALVLAAFSILFGTRHIDASEHHEGMVLAIAFESLVKLVAFLIVGLYVTFGLYDGFGDLFGRAAARPELAGLLVIDGAGAYIQWTTLILLSMSAAICLPRQFQVTVVENVNEAHLRKAVWLFPLYLLLINVFVLPIAFAGRMQFADGTVDPDTFVLTLPMAGGADGIALFAFIGGLSAATGMVIVATIALSTMVCNDLVMPILLRLKRLQLTRRSDLTQLLLGIRRGAILGILLLGYIYFRYIGESYTLVSIGLISFAAAAQFVPAIIGGILWKGATRRGALTGLGAGFVVWAYTLLLPSFAQSGWLDRSFVDDGPFGIALLKPYAFLGLDGLDHISHAMIWSWLVNIGACVGVSLFSRQSALERIQAALFVDVFRHSSGPAGTRFRRGTATMRDLYELVTRFVGKPGADRAFSAYARRHGINLAKQAQADAELIAIAERLLAGAIGAASARVMMDSVVKGEVVRIDEVLKILDEASQVIEYSHRLEQKSAELERTTAELRAANERLKELDRLKDDFLSIVSHELRTPLTSIRSFAEILTANPELAPERRTEFLGIVTRESERLTRLINQILDLAKLEAGRMEWRMGEVDAAGAIEEAVAATRALFAERGIALEIAPRSSLPPVFADRDRLIQVLLNLLSNAVKFCEPQSGRVALSVAVAGAELRVAVSDNGPGIPPDERVKVFERFHQLHAPEATQGTGLGLAISRQIVEHFGGRIWVESAAGGGARFVFSVPLAPGSSAAAAAK
ncbi:MAG: sodium:solute symporter [Alphaproteobacteria bacterium]|nr:MAG: sodium:solute symporter [Alphaproteobacteria bacterium]